MYQVSSSNISSIGYEQGNLIVKFNNGRLYIYYNVPSSIFNDFMTAPSKGQYLNINIKGRFNYSQLV